MPVEQGGEYHVSALLRAEQSARLCQNPVFGAHGFCKLLMLLNNIFKKSTFDTVWRVVSCAPATVLNCTQAPQEHLMLFPEMIKRGLNLQLELRWPSVPRDMRRVNRFLFPQPVKNLELRFMDEEIFEALRKHSVFEKIHS